MDQRMPEQEGSLLVSFWNATFKQAENMSSDGHSEGKIEIINRQLKDWGRAHKDNAYENQFISQLEHDFK